jgi:hypothetical protein
VLSALQEQNVQVASGALGAPPAPASQAFQNTPTPIAGWPLRNDWVT